MAFPTSAPGNTDPTATNKLANPSHSQLHQSHNAEIVAIEAKTGTGASTPTSGKVLRATGTGTSAWAQVDPSTDVTTMTSATLRSLLTDETGTGAAVFGTAPTISAPVVSTGTFASPVVTTPSIVTSINDANGNEVIKTPATASAVNEITVTNAATGIDPSVAPTGNDAALNLNLRGKGLAKSVTIGSGATLIYPFDFVYSGCVITADSAGVTLNWSITAGVVVINGNPITVASLSAQAATASRDTYVDVLDAGDGTGTVVRTGGNIVTNNNASPALASNSIRIGIIVSGAGSIAAVTSINQGQETRILPIASSIPYAVTDSLGNLICPRDPNRQLLGYRQITSDITNATTTYADITGLSCPVIVPTGRKVRISGHLGVGFNTVSGDGGAMNVVDVTASVTLDESQALSAAANGIFNLNPGGQPYTVPSSGSRTFKSQLKAVTGGTMHTNSSTTIPAWIKVELT